jgi:NADH-quinone oxidoreductase subunit J
MMLDINVDAMRVGFWRHFPLAAIIGVVIALEMAAVLIGGFDLAEAPAPTAQAVQLGNTKMYTHYIYPLEVASVLLLVAIIAAIALTIRSRKDSKFQRPDQQVLVKKADRLRIVQIAPTVQAPPTAPTPGARP